MEPEKKPSWDQRADAATIEASPQYQGRFIEAVRDPSIFQSAEERADHRACLELVGIRMAAHARAVLKLHVNGALGLGAGLTGNYLWDPRRKLSTGTRVAGTVGISWAAYWLKRMLARSIQ
jgi:hypothetical protein